MWAVSNETPYKADRTAVIDKQGARHWIVVVKGTFDIHPDGSTELAEEQLEPLPTPEYRGKPGQSSIIYEADLIADKPGTDLIINASAYAPGGSACKEVAVELRAGNLQKTLIVRGDRVYERSLLGKIVPSAPVPFAKMPIVYERAYGGYDNTLPDPQKQKIFSPNPVGTGIAASPSYLLGRPVANVEFSDAPMRPAEAAGFGAICSYWEPRRQYAGTYDAKWAEQQKPLLALDYDDRWNLCAPVDQQFAPHLQPNCPLDLINMTPSGRLRFSLPKIHLAFTTHFAAYSRRPPVEHRSKLHTVVIEPDVPRVIMVWHTSLSCGQAIDDIDETIVIEKEYI